MIKKTLEIHALNIATLDFKIEKAASSYPYERLGRR